MDTADEIGTLEQCLHSNLNRIKIAQVLFDRGQMELIPTILEDLLFQIQNMVDEYCVLHEE